MHFCIIKAVELDNAANHIFLHPPCKLLQDLVSSLEKKIDETEKKYEETTRVSEERLKKALEAESKINELNITMQRLLFSPT